MVAAWDGVLVIQPRGEDAAYVFTVGDRDRARIQDRTAAERLEPRRLGAVHEDPQHPRARGVEVLQIHQLKTEAVQQLHNSGLEARGNGMLKHGQHSFLLKTKKGIPATGMPLLRYSVRRASSPLASSAHSVSLHLSP